VKLKVILCRLKPDFNAVKLSEKIKFFYAESIIHNNFLFSDILKVLKSGLKRHKMTFNFTSFPSVLTVIVTKNVTV